MVVSAMMLVSLIGAGMPPPVMADVKQEELVNYAFATWIGSGIYRVGDRRMGVLRVPIRATLRPIEKDQPGVKLLMPVTLSYYDFSNSDTDFGAGSIAPGLEVGFQINDYWWVKPFGNIGLGEDTGNGDTVFFYGGGVRNLVSVPVDDFIVSFGAGLVLAEEIDSGYDHLSTLSLIELGAEVRHPIGIYMQGRELDMGLYVTVTHFLSEFEFFDPDGDSNKVRDLFEVGLTFGVDQPIDIWFLNLDRVGIDVRFGDGFDGIGLNMGFPF